MAGNSRDLTVNLVGKSDKLAKGLDPGGSATKFTAIGVTIGNLMSDGIKAGIDLAVQFAGDAFSQFLDRQDVGANLQASLGLSESVAREYGETAGNVYAQGWGSSMDEVGNAVAGFASTFGVDLMEGGPVLEALTSQALAFADIFGVDVTAAINSAGVLFKSGLAADGQEAFDLLTRGMQEMPVALRGELIDATEEYSQFFGQLGINGTEAFGLLVDASEDGQYGIDKMGDAIKEFTIRATDGSALTGSAFEAMGLDMDDMSNRILAGGDTARGAFDQIIDGLLSIEDPTEQANAAIALFGTPLEDLGTGEIPQFLEGLQSMDSELQNVEGSAQAAADTIGGTTRAKFEAFKREAIDKLIEGTVQVIDHFKEFGIGGGILKALGGLGDLLKEKGKELLNGMWQGIQSVWDSTILPWLKDLPALALKGLGALGGWLVDKGAELLGGLGTGIANVWDNVVFPWLRDLPSKALLAVPSLLTSISSRGKQLLNGLKNGVVDVWNDTVKPWLANLGSSALLAVPSLLTSISSRGKQLLNGLKNGVVDVWNDTVKPWLANLGSSALLAVPALFSTLFDKGKTLINGLKNGITNAWGTVSGWLSGIPGRIAGWFSGAGGWLVSAGRNIVSGLWNGFWNGVTSIIPGWARSFLGIGGGGPSIPAYGGFVPRGPSATPSRGNSGRGGAQVFHDGGIVQGRFGEEVLAILQAGEEVVPIGGRSSSQGGGDTFLVTVNMPAGSNGEDVLRALQNLQRRRGPLPLRVAS